MIYLNIQEYCMDYKRMVQGDIPEADTQTIWLGANPSGLISDPPPSSPIFTPDALPVTTFPI